MADPFSAVKIFIFPELAHPRSSSREEIAALRRGLRQRLVEHLEQDGDLSLEERGALLDIRTWPRLKKKYISISHCREAAGFSVADFSHGFDLEDFERVNIKTVTRISSPKDIADAPHPAALWVAKEAAFKALRARQHEVRLLSAIEDFKFSPTGQNQWTFSALAPLHVQGKLWREKRLILGLARISS